MKLSDIFKIPIKLKGGGILNLKGFNKSIIDKEVGGGGSDFPYKYLKLEGIPETIAIEDGSKSSETLIGNTGVFIQFNDIIYTLDNTIKTVRYDNYNNYFSITIIADGPNCADIRIYTKNINGYSVGDVVLVIQKVYKDVPTGIHILKNICAFID